MQPERIPTEDTPPPPLLQAAADLDDLRSPDAEIDARLAPGAMDGSWLLIGRRRDGSWLLIGRRRPPQRRVVTSRGGAGSSVELVCRCCVQ